MFSFDPSVLVSPEIVAGISVGAMIGILVGALPGLGSVITLILLLPVTFYLDPLVALLLLVSAYLAAEYGGSISAIILGVPGTPAAAATVLDGRPYARKHSPGKALGFSLVASFVGGIIGAFVLLFLSAPLSAIALQFSNSEFLLLAILGLVAITGLASKSALRTGLSVVLGLILGLVGTDTVTGENRYTFGRLELWEGIPLVVVLVGIFAITEMLFLVEEGMDHKDPGEKGTVWPLVHPRELRSVVAPTAVGSGIGSVVGAVPGMGAGVAAWFSYSAARQTAKDKSSFGDGNPAGIVGPESSNNAAAVSSLVPLLSLGIPGSPTTAIILGAFIIHGLTPGPDLFQAESDIIYGLLFGTFMACIVVFVFGIFLTPLFSKVLSVPRSYLIPVIVVLCIVGVYASTENVFHVMLSIAFGVIFYFMRKLDFSAPALILAFVLSGIIETNLRRMLLVSDGSVLPLIMRPYSLTISVVICLMVIAFIVNRKRKRTPAMDTGGGISK